MLTLDDLDNKIICVLQENARLTNSEIAKTVGSTEPTVRRRVERLLSAGAIKIVAVATPFQLGYRVIAILGLQIDHQHLTQVEEALIAMPEVRFAGVTLGSYDVIAEVWFEDTEQLLTFLHERLSKIPGVQRIESLQVAKMLKYMYDWSAPAGGK
ncbi:MAG: Lrp/AsnC family transcriptional regulator [Capsulimonas sp.]|uniref:Lrp/AsnC family transcriptional regulator n=1 Tax=Capsulimonas sp. TaxID=2494211 RepID=UPI00326677CC